MYGGARPAPIVINRSGIGVSQNLLPRPHHTIEKFKSTDGKKFKRTYGYTSDMQDIMRNTASRFNQEMPNIVSDRNDSQKNYQPVPDGRFYTKANFFTMQDRAEADALSSDEKLPETKVNSAGAVAPFPAYAYPKTQNPSQNMHR